jgi:hypothetical protein
MPLKVSTTPSKCPKFGFNVRYIYGFVEEQWGA